MIGSGDAPHVQHMVAEVIMTLEIMKGLKIASEAGATVNKYGVMTPARPPLDAARNWFPGVYKRLVEIMQLVTSSGLITIPTEADLAGPRGGDIAKYLQGAAGFGRGAGCAVPPGMGHVDQRLRWTPVALRVVLLRRPAADEAGALRDVRPQRLRRARQVVRRRHWLAANRAGMTSGRR